jgi:hypothetical protein
MTKIPIISFLAVIALVKFILVVIKHGELCKHLQQTARLAIRPLNCQSTMSRSILAEGTNLIA